MSRRPRPATSTTTASKGGATKPSEGKATKLETGETEPVELPKAQLPAVIAKKSEHPHQNLDRSVIAAMARLTGGVSPHAVADAWADWALHLSRAPGRQMELVERGQRNAIKLMRHAVESMTQAKTELPFTPKAYDNRWTHPGWQKPPFNVLQQSFLAVHDWWDQATDGLRGLRPLNADRTRFMARQMLDVVSPSNFPILNPEIIEETRRRCGKNLTEGAAHFAEDMARAITQEHKPIPEGYKIGTDLACTPGKVVFRNDICELIQYAPQTGKVRPEPVLIVPAWIMKYYVLDLSPHNSMINWLVGEGYTVFAISWCNPRADQGHLSLEDYRKRGIMAAMDAVNAIVPGQKVHVNGYCLGGTLMAIAAATMARDGDHRLASITLMAAQIDFAEAGELLLFLDESQVAYLEDMMWEQGFLDRPQMAGTFAAIRAEDLIYTRAVRRYCLGKEDLPNDLGVWSGDTTRMPARMHSEYLRGIFLENRISAGRFAVEGKVIAMKDIDVPMFVVGTETDHIAPWKSVYKTKLFTDCDLRFVLTKGGHNAGILSEPGHKGRHYRIGHRERGALYMDPDSWLARHEPQPGSWWPEWAEWLARSSGAPVLPPGMGAPDAGYAPLFDAPGTYVHQT